MQSLATFPLCITSDPKLVFSWKDSDSMMRGKFQMNSIQYGELPKQYSYHTEGPWKLYRWNLAESAKSTTSLTREGYSKLNFKWIFITDNSFGHLWKLSSHFVGLLKLSKIQGQKRNGKMLESHAISSNLSVVHHKWPNVSFLMKRPWFDDT